MLQENNGLYGPSDPDNDMFNKVRGNGNMGDHGGTHCTDYGDGV